MKLGERIIQLREARNWTTNRLANQCGLSQSFLRSVELGEKSISVDNLDILCQALDIDLKTFFDIPEDKETVLDDRLFRQIKLLTTEQRVSLSEFLAAITGFH